MVFWKTERDCRLKEPYPIVFYPFLKTLSITEFAWSVHRKWGSDANMVVSMNPKLMEWCGPHSKSCLRFIAEDPGEIRSLHTNPQNPIFFLFSSHFSLFSPLLGTSHAPLSPLSLTTPFFFFSFFNFFIEWVDPTIFTWDGPHPIISSSQLTWRKASQHVLLQRISFSFEKILVIIPEPLSLVWILSSYNNFNSNRSQIQWHIILGQYASIMSEWSFFFMFGWRLIA